MKNKRIIKGKKAWTGLFLFNSSISWCRPINRRFIICNNAKSGWISFLFFGFKWGKSFICFRFFNKKVKFVYM